MAELLKHEGNHVEFKATVPAKAVSAEYNKIVNSLMKQVKIPGFRPGKAPKSVVIKRVGQDYVDSQVQERLIQSWVFQAVQELKLQVLDIKVINGDIVDGSDYVYTVQAEVYPVVTLPEWRNFSFETQDPEITPEVIDNTLKELAERNAIFTIVDRPAEENDMVMLEEQGEEVSSYPVYLDRVEDYIKDALLGKSAGDTVTVDVPAIDHGDHQHEAHSLVVKVLEVKNKDLPAIDDEFAKVFKFDTLEALRDNLQKDLQSRAEQEGNSAKQDELVDKLIEGTEMDIPPSLIERRRNAMLEEIKINLERQNVNMKQYEAFMRAEGKYEGFLTNVHENAVKRVSRDLVTEKLAEELKTTLTETEWQSNVLAFARANRTTVQELQKVLGEEGMRNLHTGWVWDKAVREALDILQPKAAPDTTEETPTQE